ncbi:flagellin modification protein A [Aeromonas veronii]|uniref:oxidoreductase n=1 Tax=Aeromonas veronii TaxID=654 RepID=UPI001EFF07E6|nr:oxidoreductase [Aeromonas veronii]MCF5910131.1 flagellin modification protein A [Aeromonas veronii]
MEHLLNEKRILVAGAGGLLGSCLVPVILAQGGKVIAADVNVDTMAQRLTTQGVDTADDNLTLIHLDVTSEESLKAFFAQQEHMNGAVNTTYPRNKTYGAHFFDVSLASFNENISLHLGSAFLFTQQCASYFKSHKTAFSLVNISSIYGVVTPKFDIYNNTKMTMPVEYAAIKSAIQHLSKYAVAYVNDSRFRVNNVSPGGIFDHQPDAFCQAYKNHTHGAGMLDVSEIIGSIIFLLSDQSKYVTGQNIIVDDGFSL